MSQSQLARAAGVPQPNVSAYENGRRTPSAEVLARIARAVQARPSVRVVEHRDAIRQLVATHRATRPRVFGSVARGDDQPGSDVDLLVEFTDEATLLDEVGLRLALRDLLQVQLAVPLGGDGVELPQLIHMPNGNRGAAGDGAGS